MLVLVLTVSGGPLIDGANAATTSTGTLYAPSAAAGSAENASYPRVIRLTHSGTANGTMLALFALYGSGVPKANFPVYRSTDNGVTWTAAPISVVSDAVHGRDIDTPTLYELPEAVGDLAAGTLLAAGTAWNHGDESEQALEVFVSRDQGLTWTYRSACASQTGQPSGGTHGLWEPEFAITANGELACYFSDERFASSGYNQVIAHVTSTDGGRTWGKEVFDVATQDSVQRPGMPTVVQLPTGQYAMTYEACKAGFDPNQACDVFIKFSPDGESWTPSASGSRIQTEDKRFLTHTPYLSWSPSGGPNGTLIASGQRVVSGTDGALTVLPEAGHVLFINRTLGRGAWSEITTPVTTDPTGGYGAGQVECIGYSSPLVATTASSFLMLAGVSEPSGQCRTDFGTATLPLAQGQITGPGATGKCLDAAGNTGASGSAVQLYTCGVATGQRWSLETDGTIRSFDKCLDITGGGTANGVSVQLWSCNGTGGQQWQARPNGSILNPQSGRCLDDPQGQTTDGTRLRIADCNRLASQRWYTPNASLQ